MARVATPADVAALFEREGQAGEGGDAVLALLAGDRDMGKAKRTELELGGFSLDAFDLLQAEHVGPVRPHYARDEIDPQPDGVDVPGGEAEAHGAAKIDARDRKSKPARPGFHALLKSPR
jgi:hypothetical protein